MKCKECRNYKRNCKDFNFCRGVNPDYKDHECKGFSEKSITITGKQTSR